MNNFPTNRDIDREGFRFQTPVTVGWFEDWLPPNFKLSWGEQEEEKPQPQTQTDNTKWWIIGGIGALALILFLRK